MRFGRMLIHSLCRLGPPVAIRAVEIQCADAMSAGNAFERDATVHRFGCVISHITIVAAYYGGTSGHWVCNLRVLNLHAGWWSGSAEAESCEVDLLLTG